MPSSLFIGYQNSIIYSTSHPMNAKQKHQHLRVATKKNHEKAPDLLGCNLFANSVVSSDSAHFLIYSSVFMGHCLSLFWLL